MQLETLIKTRLLEAFEPEFLEVLNESHGHNVAKGSETHFKVTVVSESFKGMKLVQRHREIYKVLDKAMAQGVHALAIHTYTTEEWRTGQEVPKSPPCLGGSKHEKKP